MREERVDDCIDKEDGTRAQSSDDGTIYQADRGRQYNSGDEADKCGESGLRQSEGRTGRAGIMRVRNLTGPPTNMNTTTVTHSPQEPNCIWLSTSGWCIIILVGGDTPGVTPSRRAVSRSVSVAAPQPGPRNSARAVSIGDGSPGNTTDRRPTPGRRVAAPAPFAGRTPAADRRDEPPRGPRPGRDTCCTDGTNTAVAARLRADSPSPGSNTRSLGSGSTPPGDHRATRSPAVTVDVNIPYDTR